MATVQAGGTATIWVNGDQTVTLDTTPGTEGTVSLNQPFGASVATIGPMPLAGKVIPMNGLSGALTLKCKTGNITYVTSDSAGLTSEQMAATKAATSGSGRRGSVLDLSGYGSAGDYADTGPITRTWQLVKSFRGKPYAFRVGFKNHQTAAITLDKLTVSPSTTLALGGNGFGGDPTGGAAWTPILFGGSASVVLPAAANAQLDTITWSDVTSVAPLDRTDVVGAPWLAYFRAYFAAANYSYLSNANFANSPLNTASSAAVQLESFHTATGDLTATTGYNGTGSNAVGLPWLIEARVIGRYINMLGIGDSTYNDKLFVNGGQRAGWLQTTANNLNAAAVSGGAYYSVNNAGWPSQSISRSAPYSARLPSLLAANKYDFVFIQTYSPNDAPNTQAKLDADLAAVLDMIARVRASGAVPILSTGIPAAAALIPNAATDAFRLQSNTYWRNFAAATGTALIDIEPTVTDGATPARLLATYSSDGTHLTTDAGRDLMAAAAVRAMTLAY